MASGIFSLVMFSVLLHIDVLGDDNIYLYKCFIYAGITAAILLVVLLLAKKWEGKLLCFDFSPACIFSAAVICLLALGFFSSTVIMPMDRSYTIFTLADMADNDGEVYSMEKVENEFIGVYIQDMQNTERRIAEQVEIGNLIAVDGGYQISEKGARLVNLYRFIDKLYPVDNKTSIYPGDWKK